MNFVREESYIVCDSIFHRQPVKLIQQRKNRRTSGSLKFGCGQIVLHTLHGIAVVHARAEDAASECSCGLRRQQISDV
jgi:hypothetical protein